MAEGSAETLHRELSDVFGALGLELFDVEIAPGTVRVTVERPGRAVSLDELADANRAVSAVLDRVDPVPGHYTLEVSSPGLERRLRTPAHFSKAVGEVVSVRLQAGAHEVRRLTGTLVSVDEHGIAVKAGEIQGGTMVVPYEAIDRARTVFEWGAKAAPSPSRARSGSGSKGKERATTP